MTPNGTMERGATTLRGTAPHSRKRTGTMKDVTIIYCKPCRYDARAKEAADALKRELSIRARLVPGKGGIFEVRVDDKVVAKRVNGHFPATAQIVGSVSAALK